MTDEDIEKLVVIVLRKHAQGKHVMFLVEGYDMEELAQRLVEKFSDATRMSLVEFVRNGLWVCFRPVLNSMPLGLMKQPGVAVIVLTP